MGKPVDKTSKGERAAESAPADLSAGIVELYQSAPVAYLTLDGQGVVRDLNRCAAELLRVDRQLAVGLPFRLSVATNDRREIAAHFSRFRESGHAVSEVRLKRGDVETEVSLESRRTALGHDLCFMTVLDMSDRRRADRDQVRMAKAEHEARQVSAVQDQFVAMLSHELRTPLAPILAAVTTLEKETRVVPSVARLYEIIRRNVLREARLVDDLLDVSRIRSGKVRLQRETTDLHLVAREAAEMLAGEATARRLSVRLELDARHHCVSGEPSRLRQVFANLLKNAVKFTPEAGEVALRSWNNGHAIVVEISDTGIGIEPGALDRIFERFEQLPVPDGVQGGGLGLGLAISRAIVDLHGGTIVAHSAGRGRGSRFLVEIDALQAEVRPKSELAHRQPPARAPRLRDAEILIVEDEPDLAEALSMLLESEGYRVQTAPTAAAALAAKLDNVHLVISDIGLPDLDGRQLLPRLKSKQPMKAIALSGYGTEADLRASLDAGFDRHLTKPVEMHVLLEAVDLACSETRPTAHRSRVRSKPSSASKRTAR